MMIKVLNKYLALEYLGSGSPRVIANPYELVKQECMLEATGRKLPVPRFMYYKGDTVNEMADLDCWATGVTGLTREQIEPLDFSKPYDDDLINELQKAAPKKENKKVQINADDLINAELELIKDD